VAAAGTLLGIVPVNGGSSHLAIVGYLLPVPATRLAALPALARLDGNAAHPRRDTANQHENTANGNTNTANGHANRANGHANRANGHANRANGHGNGSAARAHADTVQPYASAARPHANPAHARTNASHQHAHLAREDARAAREDARAAREDAHSAREDGDGLVVNAAARQVLVGGRDAGLVFQEFNLLAHLASNPGLVLTREHLLARVWGEAYQGSSRTVDVHIHRLRRKLGPEHGQRLITVRRVGYLYRPGT
jgi:Transcriptional regulatory protein, C terminal